MSINRNIVECKDKFYTGISIRRLSINRNIVECKEELRCHRNTEHEVLIETLWNVKLLHHLQIPTP